MCLEEFSKSDIYTGGIIPYWNNLLRTVPDHGYEMVTKTICHMCCICGTTYGGTTIGGIIERPPYEYPIRFTPGTAAKIEHNFWACPYNFKLKYYRIYKIIQKIQELQPRDGIESPLTYTQAMEQITLAGANVIFGDIPAGDLDRVITDIKTRKTFLPVDISMFPNIDMKVLYPPIGKIKRIPNMRKMNDIIINKLMPEIKVYPEVKNPDGTSQNPKVYASPEDPITEDTNEKFIKFRHREFTIDNNYQIKEHESISLETFMASFNSTISQIDQVNFGKCVLFPFEVEQGKCKSYLYPEELGLLINEGVIDQATYIKYRDTFHNSDLIQIEHSADAKKYFIPETVARAGGGIRNFSILDDKFKEKYLKYKAKYLQLKNQTGGDEVEEFIKKIKINYGNTLGRLDENYSLMVANDTSSSKYHISIQCDPYKINVDRSILPRSVFFQYFVYNSDLPIKQIKFTFKSYTLNYKDWKITNFNTAPIDKDDIRIIKAACDILVSDQKWAYYNFDIFNLITTRK